MRVVADGVEKKYLHFVLDNDATYTSWFSIDYLQSSSWTDVRSRKSCFATAIPLPSLPHIAAFFHIFEPMPVEVVVSFSYKCCCSVGCRVDLQLASATKNYFSIAGDTTNARSFLVNSNYGGCDVDAGARSVSSFQVHAQNC